MQIEIWSDVVCPFCYLGKGRLEKALESFPGRDQVDIAWKSFLLHPGLKRRPGQGLEDYLSERKGWPLAQIRVNHERLARAGAELGLEYRFDKVLVADSFDAHRLSRMADAEGKAGVLEGILFRAYFGEGVDIADPAALAGLAAEAGLDSAKAAAVLADKGAFADRVQADLEEAQAFGISGVPFFVFDRRFAVSGAQDVEVFRRALAQASSP